MHGSEGARILTPAEGIFSQLDKEALAGSKNCLLVLTWVTHFSDIKTSDMLQTRKKTYYKRHTTKETFPESIKEMFFHYL